MVLDEVANAIKKIAEFFGKLLDHIDDIIDVVTDWWGRLEDRLRSGISRAWNEIYGDWDWFISRIHDAIEDAKTDIARAVDEALGDVSGVLEDVSSWFSVTYQAIYDFASTVDSALSDVASDLGGALDDAVSAVTQGLDSLTETITSELKALGEAIGEKMTTAVEWTFERFTDLMDKAIEGSIDTLQMLLADMEISFGGLPESINIATSYAGPSQFHQFLDIVSDIVSAPARAIYEAIIRWLEYEPPADPQKAREATARYITTILAFNTIPKLAAKIPDLVQPFKNWGIDRIVQDIYWSLGLGWLSWIVFAEPFRAIIADPLQEYYREKYKTAPTPRSLIDEMFKRYKISEDEYRQWLSKLGYRDELIPMFIATARNPPSDSAIKYALQAGLITKEQAYKFIQDQGYTEEALELEYAKIVHDALQRERDITQSQILRAYRLGLISYDQALRMLQDLGYSEEIARLILDLEDADQRLELRELQVKIILEDLKDGVIDRDTAVRRLVEAGVPQRKAELLADLTLARKRTEPRERITKADIRALFKAGKLSKEEAVTLLESLGYAESIATMLVELWEAEEIEEPRKLSRDIIVRAYKAGLIDRDTALRMLQDLGYTAEAADLILRLEEAEEARELQELRVKVVLEDLKDGYITPEEAIQRLQQSGIPADRAQILVELEMARARVKRRQAPTLSQIRDFYVNGLIDRNTALQWLELIGYTRGVAELFVKLWDMRMEPDTRELSRSVIIKAFRVGVLDYQQALNYLKDIGYSEEAARLLLDIEVADEAQDLINEQAENVLLAYRYDLITEDEARDRLLRMGIAAPRVEVMIERERIRKERPKEPRRISATMILRALRGGILTIDEADALLEEIGYTDPRDRAIMIALYLGGEGG